MSIVFDKQYTDESLINLEEDISYALEKANVPTDEYGFHRGTFHVTITWVKE